MSELIPGRPINMNLDCPRVFQQISSWINNCATTHSACINAGSSSARSSPSRLLRIDEEQVNLQEIANSKEVLYTTLTHCWESEPTFTTTRSSLQAHLDQIPFYMLNKTFQDAI
jgi:hypothetical protein